MHGLTTILRLTLHEAARKRVLLAALLFGIAFVAVFAIGFHFVERDLSKQAGVPLVQRRMMLDFFILAGLYAVNMLTLVTAVLLPVDTLSGEIASGVMQTVASKPIRRETIVLGKWLAYELLIAGYLLLLAGGVLVVARWLSGVSPPAIARGLPLMLLEGTVLTSLCFAGGSRFTTITNGVIVFGLYGIAFIGSWVEQVGAHVGNEATRYIGTLASLVMPSEALWQLAAWHMQPSMMRDLHLTPFSPASVPSPAMVAWAGLYAVVALALAVRHFTRRPL
jgi:ABC-2 type transport system permease protein